MTEQSTTCFDRCRGCNCIEFRVGDGGTVVVDEVVVGVTAAENGFVEDGFPSLFDLGG